MTVQQYFNRYGKIYGASYKYSFGRWTGYIKEFTNLEQAQEWLNTEEQDFRQRELGSLSRCAYLVSNAV